MQPIIRKEHIGKEENEKNSEQDIFCNMMAWNVPRMQMSDNS